jgi:hypothetical protein
MVEVQKMHEHFSAIKLNRSAAPCRTAAMEGGTAEACSACLIFCR